jgi:asparagine synthase (glutamine-hydrolysing)
VALGSRRLRILDLSDAGRQPLENEDGSNWLVYNGEIYNYRELRDELLDLGHRFRSETDTEVIVHAYEEWGDSCLDRFNGMFAFALWDEARRRLFCARDRVGVKPLYYTRHGSALLLASEIKALLVALPATPSPDESTIADYIALDHVDHSERTFFSGIRQLGAGHVLTADVDGLSVGRWWEPGPGEGGEVRRADADEQFRELFDDAVRLRLRSDVPVGSCLSGGLDSSSVVCTVNGLLGRDDARAVGATQKTFSAVFPSEPFDESRYIDAVAAVANVEQHRVAVQGDALLTQARRVLAAQDEPFGSTSIIAQWHVMALARSGDVTVLLDGQGGDELLAGYHNLIGYRIADLLRRGRVGAAARETLAYHRSQSHSWLRTGRLVGVPLVPGAARTRLRTLDKDAHGLLPRRLRSLPAESRLAPAGLDLLSAERYRVYRYALPALLRYEDRNSMAFSLEARLPFLDYRLIELSFRLPAEALVAHGRTKALLRDALGPRLPDAVRERPDKIGFLTPQARWLREARTEIHALIGTAGFGGGFVQNARVRDLLDAVERGRPGADYALWRCVCLDLWLRETY